MSSITLPSLVEGRVYQRSEVDEYIGKQESGQDDYEIVENHFPRLLDDWPKHDLAGWRDNEEVLLRYRLVTTSSIKSHLRNQQQQLLKDDTEEHERRIGTIVELLGCGKCGLPVFMQMNDPHFRICEGKHRAIAFRRIGSDVIPVFFVGYRDWFSCK